MPVMGKAAPPLEDDIRWQRLMRTGVKCVSCGETHRGLFDLATDGPEHWQGSREKEPNSALEGRTDILTEDFCVIEGRDRFIRCVLELPIVGSSEEVFGYGVWSTLSPANFDRYVETFDSGDQDDLGPWFGWFSNRLTGYPDTLNLKCQVHPRSGRQRPLIELEPTDHPLAVEQREGITIDRLMELFALNGHDLGAAPSPGRSPGRR
jgi:hypothetical protein